MSYNRLVFDMNEPSGCIDIPQYAVPMHAGAPLELKKPSCDTALICFTSGTTAAAKGVRITHTALHLQSLVKVAVVGYSSRDVYLHVAPLFHIGVPLPEIHLQFFSCCTVLESCHQCILAAGTQLF